jgi:hypothetical protein
MRTLKHIELSILRNGEGSALRNGPMEKSRWSTKRDAWSLDENATTPSGTARTARTSGLSVTNVCPGTGNYVAGRARRQRRKTRITLTLVLIAGVGSGYLGASWEVPGTQALARKISTAIWPQASAPRRGNN